MPSRRDPRNGHWFFQKVVRLPDGTKERIFGTPNINTKAASDAAERDKINEILKRFHSGQRREIPAFNEFTSNRWLTTYPASVGNEETTVKEKEIHVRLYLNPFFGNTPLDQIRGEKIDCFFAWLHTKGIKAKTIKNIQATLRRILASAVDWEILASVPKLPKVKVPDASWDFYTAEESDKLFAAARSPEELALLVLAIHTGARAGEQREMRWSDIDWVNRQVIFRRSIPHNTKTVKAPKSNHERRVPMTNLVEKTLLAIRGLQHLRDGLVFVNQSGRRMTMENLHDRLEAVALRAGLRKVTWHQLRHSFGSQLATAGVPIPRIQQWMGHSEIKMTMRYARLAPEGVEGSAIAALDRGVSAEFRASVAQAGTVIQLKSRND